MSKQDKTVRNVATSGWLIKPCRVIRKIGECNLQAICEVRFNNCQLRIFVVAMCIQITYVPNIFTNVCLTSGSRYSKFEKHTTFKRLSYGLASRPFNPICIPTIIQFIQADMKKLYNCRDANCRDAYRIDRSECVVHYLTESHRAIWFYSGAVIQLRLSPPIAVIRQNCYDTEMWLYYQTETTSR